MSDGLLKLFGSALLSVMLIVILRRQSPDSALTMKMAVGVTLSLVCVGTMSPIIEYIREIGDSFGGGEGMSAAVEVLLKALGVSILTHICATVCRDSGEGSIAYYVEMGGKIEILLLSLPLLREMTDMALELLELN